MIGTSRVMADLLSLIDRLADCDDPVLITGECGTGKDLAARLIHQRSRRAFGPYVAVDCADASSRSIALGLFGATQRSPDGLAKRIPGSIEHAHRGTLFLDEIDGMPFRLQESLARFLRSGETTPIGGGYPVKVDARIVAASRVRPQDALAAGTLRGSLYDCLSASKLHLPPLRERGADVEALADYFLLRAGHALGRDFDGFTPAAVAALATHPWPGNVRELIAAIERTAASAAGSRVDVADLRLDQRLPRPVSARGRTARLQAVRPKPGSATEREAVLRALDDSRLNMTRAAQLLGVARATLYRMLRRHRIEPDAVRLEDTPG